MDFAVNLVGSKEDTGRKPSYAFLESYFWKTIEHISTCKKIQNALFKAQEDIHSTP